MLSFLCIGGRGAGQTIYKRSNQALISISGTTPVKDWQMSTHTLGGSAQLDLSEGAQLHRIEWLNFSVPVRSLKGAIGAMNDDACHSLKADQFKEITFTLDSSSIETASIPSNALVKAHG
jgi:hypothetical protein